MPEIVGRPVGAVFDTTAADDAGPCTVARDSFDSIRPSRAQTAPATSQSVVSGSVTVTGPSPSGSTWIVQCLFVPGPWRLARVTVPPVALMPPNFSVR